MQLLELIHVHRLDDFTGEMSETQDAINLLREMIPMLDPADDYMTVVRAEEDMQTKAEQRGKDMDKANTQLRSLTQILDAAKISSTRPQNVPSEEEHARMLNELDSLRSSLAKSINDGEGTIAGKEAELARLKQEWAKLEASDPAASHDLDGTTLRLALIRGLGFEPITDKNGNLVKMLVRSINDVYSVSFSEKKSNAEYANQLWSLASFES